MGPNARSSAAAVLASAARLGFPRGLTIGLEEAELIRLSLKSVGIRNGVMVDVGAHVGTVTARFAPHGWEVHAFEPDPSNRQRFRERFDDHDRVFLDARAVSEIDGQRLDFFASEVSSGISGLVNFHQSHRVTAEVETVRLDTYLAEAGRPSVDFVKVDTEGYDLFVLKSYDWELPTRPAAILCEYEDAKTEIVGYTTVDLADFLLDLGYTLLVSEWHPIEEYGRVHSWRRLTTWNSDPSIVSKNSQYLRD